jgi:tRNA A-37 threonylcarbamoyl transferase component Bud32
VADDSRTDLEPARPAVVEAEPIRIGSVLAGRYVVEANIGRGGMGIVVRAHDRTLGERVAIKIVRAEYAHEPIWSERLAREVKLARQIQHPNVCRVFDFEQADGRVFLVMELATRGTLRDEIAAGATCARPFSETLADVRAMAAGLAAIHAAGIVHRDLSPQNLLRMADGRLVLSDFGLATDPSESTTSIRGGTVAYMAPEIVRGGKAGFASDVWALGAVIYETVFSERPIWHWKRGPEMVAPAGTLTREERAIFEVCRACTAADPSRRPARGADVAARLTDAALGRRDWRRWGLRVGVAICAAAAAAAAPTIWKRARRRPEAAPAPAGEVTPPLLEIVGEPADWTHTSRVLGEIPDRVRCAVPLPDHRNVRIVWGRPPRAEDIDTMTGRRTASPIVPSAYAEGCPDLSPDGKLLYQGHTPDKRAFAFLADNPEGRDALPIVATAEPTHLSEPRWLSDRHTFAYDVDGAHIGVFSLETHRSTVVLAMTQVGSGSFFRWTSGHTLFAGESNLSRRTTYVALDDASLAVMARFVVPRFTMDMVEGDAGRYVGVGTGLADRFGVFDVDLSRRTARRIGFIPGQELRNLIRTEAGWFFSGRRERTLIVLPPGTTEAATTLEIEAVVDTVAACGADLLLAEADGEGKARIARRSRSGTLVEYLSNGPDDGSVSCSRDGRWFYVQMSGDNTSVRRCDAQHCEDLMTGKVWRAQVSPDGSKLAVISVQKRGPTVSWMDVREPNRLHVLRETETICAPSWSAQGTLWISRREGATVVWTEIDLASGRETGRRQPGRGDCTDGVQDPTPPGVPEPRLIPVFVTQLRVISAHATGH